MHGLFELATVFGDWTSDRFDYGRNTEPGC